jgi:protein-S-isoprenylcysteine O-methyltransferase Ste14
MIIVRSLMIQTEKQDPTPTGTKRSTFYQLVPELCGILFILQILLFMFYYDFSGVVIVRWIGWILLILAFLLFTLSKSALKLHGAPEENKSWVFTTVLVQQGIYRVVRHPFSLGWIIMTIGLALVSQYWLSVLFMIIQLPVIAFGIISEEKTNVEKFQTEYINYRKSVPMVNLFKGFVQYFLDKRRSLSSE